VGEEGCRGEGKGAQRPYPSLLTPHLSTLAHRHHIPLPGQYRSNPFTSLHTVGPRLRNTYTVTVAAGTLQGRETLFKPFQRCDSFTVTKRVLGDGVTPACDVREDGLTVDS